MQDAGRVDVLEAPQQLVKEQLVVLVRELLLGLQHTVQVRLHQIVHHVQVLEVPLAPWLQHSLDGDDLRNAWLRPTFSCCSSRKIFSSRRVRLM